MRYETTEVDDLPTTETLDYTKPPTMSEAFRAHEKNTLSSGILESESNYAQDQMISNVDTLIEQDPDNERYYNILKSMSKPTMKMMEMQYQNGTLQKYGSRDARSQAFMLYKDKAGLFNVPDIDETFEIAKGKSKKDYDDSMKVIQENEHFWTGMAGAMWGQLHSPTQALMIPFGGSGATVTGGILKTAATLTAREMAIAAPYEAMAAAQEYDYKNDIDIRFSIKDAATNFAVGTAAPGVLRGVGSAAFDLTAKGLKDLKVKDPELGADYENLTAKKITESDEEHLYNMARHEAGEKVDTTNPTPEMEAIMKQPPQREFAEVEEIDIPTGQKYEAESLHMGKDAKGDDIVKSYKEMGEELDQEDVWLKQIEDCILKGA